MSDVIRSVRGMVARNPLFRPLLSAWFGTRYSAQHYAGKVLWPYWSILKTGEFHNFTYELTDTSLRYLVELVAIVTHRHPAEIEGYVREAIEDSEINAHFKALIPGGVATPFGRRLGWYAVARALKPRVVVETGVERGHGSVLLCAALLRNAAEGSPGRYYGTDINPRAGWLLTGKYATVGKILYGDSIQSLQGLDGQIDLFVNDSDHSADYEAREYETVAGKLSANAIVLGDNAHVTDRLARFARATDRRFLFFKEVPKSHWYPGAGIGFAFDRNVPKTP